MTNHGEQPLSTLHSQRVQELLCLQPLLKQVGDTEVLSVPPLYLHLAKKRNSRSKTQEAVAVWAIRAMYKGHLLALDSFQSKTQRKDVNILEETHFLFLCLSCWSPNVVEVCLRLCNTHRTIIYLNLGQLMLHSHVHQSYFGNRK